VSPIRWKAAFALTAFWALAVSATASDAPAQPKDQSADTLAIEAVFSAYKDALLKSDGSGAADVLSARTIAFYDGIVHHALNTSRAKLGELDFISKLMVARIRLEFTREQISRMTGRELLVIGVDNGWISKSSVANIDRLVEIKVASSEATASMPVAPGVPAFRFLKEPEQWKLDLVASFDLANAAMKHEITTSGLTEEQFIIRLLRVLSSKKVDERIFSPPL
jgi:hypothetical protein